MFWKSTAWSWHNAAGDDDDDEGGYLLAAELRKSPDATLARMHTEQTAAAGLNHTAAAAAIAPPNLSNFTVTTNDARLGDSPIRGPITNHPYGLDSAHTNYASYVSTLYANANQQPTVRVCSECSKPQLMVSIIRGTNGFGFTICSNCPVRVQAVDPGGPAHLAGLQQSDWLLQLNGVPVETWKCVDLAHAIRSCPSQIVLVVWRGVPEVKSGCEGLLRPPAADTTTIRKLLPHPTHSKHGRQRGQMSGVRSSLGALSLLWRDRKDEREQEEEEEEEEIAEYSPCTTMLKGTHVTSSNGDNYIILSPVNPGSQLLQPVYHDRDVAMGHLYQTHPCSGHNLLPDPQHALSWRPFNSHTATLPPQPSSTSSSSCSATPGNYGNYQNCTIVQSHLASSSYGSCITLSPKTVIFPIFVQPLDLCSPERTLLMSEEMILHQDNLLPAKVTVLIYSDLLLLTREDEAGCCNVLQSPEYLNTLQLREAASEPLLILFLSLVGWRCLFSLEAFSLEQKSRVSICLHDNIQQQLVTTETSDSTQLSDLHSDFGLLSLGHSDLLCCSSSTFSSSDLLHHRPPSPFTSLCDSYRPPSPLSSSLPPPSFSSLSPYTSSHPTRTFTTPLPSFASTQQSTTTPMWRDRMRGGGGGAKEDEAKMKMNDEKEEVEKEERQQAEGESASETSESMGAMRGWGLLSSPEPSPTEEEEDSDEEEEEEEEGGGDVLSSTYKPAALRRSLSEGTLLQEPRSPRFLSDSTIHRLIRPAPGPAPRPPSPPTLRKQLTREGSTLQHMLLLLNGTKNGDVRNLQRKKTKRLADDVQNRLAFLRRRNKNNLLHGNSLEKALRNHRPSAGDVLRWAESLEALLTNQYGLAVFRHFLKSEFSEENLDFWLAVERFKRTGPPNKMAARAAKIFEEYISTSAERQVNVDSSVREATNQSLRSGVSSASFQLAQDQIFTLMETDSHPRFLRSHLYAQLTNYSAVSDSASQ